MEELKNFWNQYKGAIIGIVVAILILCTKLYEFIIGCVVIILGAMVGSYVQKNKDSVKEKIKSFIDKMISDYKDEEVKFKNFKIHNTVVARYKKEGGVATIYFSSSYEYFLERNGKSFKTQDRARTEFIYIYDEKKLSKDIKAIGLHCPNCGSPITSLGEKSCSYCGTAVKELIKKIFVCNDIVRY